VFEIAGTATMHNSFFLLRLLGFFPLSLDDYTCMKTFFVCFSQNCKKGTLAMPITFLRPLRGSPSSTVASRVTPELFPSIVLVIAGEKRFPPPNFNLKIVRIQRGGGSWMLLDAVLHCCLDAVLHC
jgi:hypothetical protein